MNRLKDVLIQIISFRWVVTLVKVVRRNVKRFFATRLLLKLMSLVLGVLLWYAIAATEVTLAEETIRDVPVHVLAPTDSLREALLEPPVVAVDILAPKSLLPSLDAKSIRAFVDLTAWSNGGARKMVPEVVLPKGVRLARPPAAVTVKMEVP